MEEKNDLSDHFAFIEPLLLEIWQYKVSAKDIPNTSITDVQMVTIPTYRKLLSNHAVKATEHPCPKASVLEHPLVSAGQQEYGIELPQSFEPLIPQHFMVLCISSQIVSFLLFSLYFSKLSLNCFVIYGPISFS